jgi:hypothetical protein
MLGQDVVDQVCGSLVHASPQAARAETPTLATEGHEMAFVASVAVHLRESVRKDAAGQELLQFLGDVPGQAVAVLRVGPHPLEAG